MYGFSLFLRWEKGKKGLRLLLRARGMRESQTLFPTARGSLRPFFPLQKGKPRTFPNPLSENPLSATHDFLGQRSCRTKVSRSFRIFLPQFCPEFCSEISPNFSRTFRASFRGKRRPEKFTKNPRHFSMQNSQANTKKIFTKSFWRAGKVIILMGGIRHSPKGARAKGA